MKHQIFNFPSFGTVHAGGYWLALIVLLFANQVVFLNFLVFATFAVPVRGVFDREPDGKLRKLGVTVTLLAVLNLGLSIWKKGAAGLFFYWADGIYGFPEPALNSRNLLLTGLILLPLSMACGIDRIRNRKIQE